jgi:two-component system chemotaxis response regulator CheB
LPRRDIVVIGASAGGIEALQHVLADVPADFDAAVFVVLHIAPGGGRSLAAILDRAGPLTAAPAQDGEPIKSGRIYVCVADHHLLVGDGHVHVKRGPQENGHRPAADPLFRSAARYFGPRVIGVILSGALSDGTAGLSAIRRQGGIAITQDPTDAAFDGMPTYALDHVGADHVLPAREIGPLLARLVQQDVHPAWSTPSSSMLKEVALMETDDGVLDEAHPGHPSSWPCPDCNGVLWEVDDDEVLRFRCRVGHAWVADNLLHQQEEAVEQALWMALRALEDRAALNTAMADRAEHSGRKASAERFRADVHSIDENIQTLRRLLGMGESPPGEVVGNMGG